MLGIMAKIQRGCPPACLAVMLAFVACTPSREFLLKRSAEVSADKKYVRVLIAQTGDRITVSSGSRIKITDLKTRKIHYDGRGRSFNFYPEKVTKPVALESWNSPLCVNGKCYRGTIEIHGSMGKLLAINVVKMDEYLYGVIPSEISSGWDMEALKAQAVAARTYTYYHLMNSRDLPYDLDATSNFQVYGGLSVETEKTRKAVDDTSGEIAVYNGKPIVAYFHSTCGGVTSEARCVWSGSDLNYLKAIKCKFCGESPYFSWKEHITLYEIKRCLSLKYKGIGPVSGISLKKNGKRVTSVNITHRNGLIKLSGNDFRLLFPEKRIKSLYFDAQKTNNGLVLFGHGWGHGVGLCQWGANGMALKGAKYKDILKYYYKGISIMSAGAGMTARKNAPGILKSVRSTAHPEDGV